MSGDERDALLWRLCEELDCDGLGLVDAVVRLRRHAIGSENRAEMAERERDTATAAERQRIVAMVKDRAEQEEASSQLARQLGMELQQNVAHRSALALRSLASNIEKGGAK